MSLSKLRTKDINFVSFLYEFKLQDHFFDILFFWNLFCMQYLGSYKPIFMVKGRLGVIFIYNIFTWSQFDGQCGGQIGATHIRVVAAA
jgi:hypothetical protein